MPAGAEINEQGRTIIRWCPQIINWHIFKVTNRPTGSLNNLIKRINGRRTGSATSLTTESGPPVRGESEWGPPRCGHSPPEVR